MVALKFYFENPPKIWSNNWTQSAKYILQHYPKLIKISYLKRKIFQLMMIYFNQWYIFKPLLTLFRINPPNPPKEKWRVSMAASRNLLKFMAPISVLNHLWTWADALKHNTTRIESNGLIASRHSVIEYTISLVRLPLS